jgi:hypothetical protein
LSTSRSTRPSPSQPGTHAAKGPRPVPPANHVPASRNQATHQGSRPHPLGLALPTVVRLAGRAPLREAGHRHRMATQALPESPDGVEPCVGTGKVTCPRTTPQLRGGPRRVGEGAPVAWPQESKPASEFGSGLGVKGELPGGHSRQTGVTAPARCLPGSREAQTCELLAPREPSEREVPSRRSTSASTSRGRPA